MVTEQTPTHLAVKIALLLNSNNSSVIGSNSSVTTGEGGNLKKVYLFIHNNVETCLICLQFAGAVKKSQKCPFHK